MCRRSNQSSLSRLSLVALMPLMLSFVFCLLGFFAPFWMIFPEHQSHRAPIGQVSAHPLAGDEWAEGLWAKCYLDDHRCDWFWQNGDTTSSFNDWHKAAQGLYTVGLLCLLAAVIVAVCVVCCSCGCLILRMISSIRAIASLLLVYVAFVTSSVAVYGWHSAKERQVYEGSYNPTFGWSFYVAIAGVASAVVSSSIYFWDSCRGHTSRSREGYQMANIASGGRTNI